jgi:hypothetical protein
MIPNWIKAAWHFQGIGAQQRSWPFSIENDRGPLPKFIRKNSGKTWLFSFCKILGLHPRALKNNIPLVPGWTGPL